MPALPPLGHSFMTADKLNIYVYEFMCPRGMPSTTFLYDLAGLLSKYIEKNEQ